MLYNRKFFIENIDNYNSDIAFISNDQNDLVTIEEIENYGMIEERGGVIYCWIADMALCVSRKTGGYFVELS